MSESPSDWNSKASLLKVLSDTDVTALIVYGVCGMIGSRTVVPPEGHPYVSDMAFHKKVFASKLATGQPDNIQFVPYGRGPWSRQLDTSVRFLGSQGLLETNSRPIGNAVIHSRKLSPEGEGLFEYVFPLVGQSPEFEAIRKQLSKMRNATTNDLEKVMTRRYQDYLDSDRQLLYVDNAMKEEVEGKGTSGWKIAWPISPLEVSMQGPTRRGKKLTTGDKGIYASLREARRNTPTHVLLSEDYHAGRKSWRKFLPRPIGSALSLIYNPVEEVTSVWEKASPTQKSELLSRGLTKSIGYLQVLDQTHEIRVGSRTFFEGEFRDCSMGEQGVNSIPALIDPKDMRVSHEAFLHCETEVLWKIVQITGDCVEMFPLCVTKLFSQGGIRKLLKELRS